MFLIFRRQIQKKRICVSKKKGQLVNLMFELYNCDALKELSKVEIQKIEGKLKNTVFNLGHVNSLYQTMIRLVDSRRGQNPATEMSIVSESGTTYYISMNQVVIVMGWAYASACEFKKQWFSSVIDFSKFVDRKGRPCSEPAGIVTLIKILKSNRIKHLNYFDEVDSVLRNSFFHLDFRFSGDKIYCKHTPRIHFKNKWRTPKDNAQNKYIRLSDLMKSLIDADRSNLSLIHLLTYLSKKSV